MLFGRIKTFTAMKIKTQPERKWSISLDQTMCINKSSLSFQSNCRPTERNSESKNHHYPVLFVSSFFYRFNSIQFSFVSIFGYALTSNSFIIFLQKNSKNIDNHGMKLVINSFFCFVFMCARVFFLSHSLFPTLCVLHFCTLALSLAFSLSCSFLPFFLSFQRP